MEKIKKLLLAFVMVMSITLTFFCVGCGNQNSDLPDGQPEDNIVDFDLTTMSASQMDNILASLSTYYGKTMRVEGKYTYTTYYGDRYHFIIPDGSIGCCVPEFTHTSYPPINTRIRIEGEVSKYIDIHDEHTYYYIDVTKMEVL